MPDWKPEILRRLAPLKLSPRREAEIADDACIGPYCRIGSRVQIGKNCRFESHVIVEGPTTIGEDNQFYPFGTIGLQPQDLKFKGEETFLTIGNRNIFRKITCNHMVFRSYGSDYL